MPSFERHYSFLDQLIINVDQGLRTIANIPSNASRENPGINISQIDLSPTEQQHSAGLMRVDHSGEVCAQALYQGQAWTANSAKIRATMQQSALEENDHLIWCQQRLEELNSHASYLNPLWYFGSLCLGIIAGLIGDKWNLGFVAETERQVVNHLEKHLQQLPANDSRSQKILQQMRADEAHHATVAYETGAAELPDPIKQLMKIMAKIMTTTAYWI